ncbi:uncharacterized protein LOC126768132 isoform X5 [Nymphalis io]|uniref:uncharacterized protein LOC126768132 isoform X5 n=1 Tax=Inachis io TaxID=171585 RepID=UPI0021699135|nr:uncharacterized protein LOC126768132 isoform X5 [Nymphalis io]
MEHIRQFDWCFSQPDIYFLKEDDLANSVTEKILRNKFYDPLISSDSEDENITINWDEVFTKKENGIIESGGERRHESIMPFVVAAYESVILQGASIYVSNQKCKDDLESSQSCSANSTQVCSEWLYDDPDSFVAFSWLVMNGRGRWSELCTVLDICADCFSLGPCLIDLEGRLL